MAVTKDRAIVARGALRALPTMVRRSSDIPNADSQRTADKTYLSSECRDLIPCDNVATIADSALALVADAAVVFLGETDVGARLGAQRKDGNTRNDVGGGEKASAKKTVEGDPRPAKSTRAARKCNAATRLPPIVIL